MGIRFKSVALGLEVLGTMLHNRFSKEGDHEIFPKNISFTCCASSFQNNVNDR